MTDKECFQDCVRHVLRQSTLGILRVRGATSHCRFHRDKICMWMHRSRNPIPHSYTWKSDTDCSSIATQNSSPTPSHLRLAAHSHDLDENGVLDIITVSKPGDEYEIKGFYNNFLNDAFHLKALALDGYGKQEYSSTFPGAVFMFTLTELDMSKVQMHST